jgi:hypothetical protein
VNAATARSDTIDIDLNDLTFGKQSLQFLFGGKIGFCITEFRRNDRSVTYIETDVCGML